MRTCKFYIVMGLLMIALLFVSCKNKDVLEVTDAHEKWEEKPVYRLTMRQTSKPAVVKQEDIPGIGDESEESFA